MNIKEAFEYVRSNNNDLSKNGEIVAGVAFVPGDSDGEFQFFTLNHQQPDNEDEYAFLAYFQGGSLFSSSSTEETYGGDTLEEVLAEMPILAQHLNYQIYRCKQPSMDMTAEAWLCELYSQLPDPEAMDTDRSAFKIVAIGLISELGNSFQHTPLPTKH